MLTFTLASHHIHPPNMHAPPHTLTFTSSHPHTHLIIPSHSPHHTLTLTSYPHTSLHPHTHLITPSHSPPHTLTPHTLTVEVQLDEPLWVPRVGPQVVAMEIMALCVQLDLIFLTNTPDVSHLFHTLLACLPYASLSTQPLSNPPEK